MVESKIKYGTIARNKSVGSFMTFDTQVNLSKDICRTLKTGLTDGIDMRGGKIGAALAKRYNSFVQRALIVHTASCSPELRRQWRYAISLKRAARLET